MFVLNQKYTIGKVGFSWSTLPNCEGKKVGSRDGKFLPLVPQLLPLVWDLGSQAVGPGLRWH